MLAVTTSQGLSGPRQQRLLARRAARPLRLAAAPQCAAGGTSGTSWDAPAGPVPALARGLTAAAAALLLASAPAALPPPASAELSTITAQQATEMAKPLKQQKVNKGRIWALFVLGATALFGTTVLLENNEKWFPAISRANRAMKAAQQRASAVEQAAEQEQAAFEARLAAVQQERAVDAAVDAAVLEGLAEARQRGGDTGGSSTSNGSVATAAVASAAMAQEAAPAVAEAAEAAAAPPAAADEPSVAEQHSSSAAAPPAAAPSADDSGSADSGAAAEGEQAPRKPLFEISAEQIEASSAKRMEQLQAELERRKAAAAGGPPEA